MAHHVTALMQWRRGHYNESLRPSSHDPSAMNIRQVILNHAFLSDIPKSLLSELAVAFMLIDNVVDLLSQLPRAFIIPSLAYPGSISGPSLDRRLHESLAASLAFAICIRLIVLLNHLGLVAPIGMFSGRSSLTPAHYCCFDILMTTTIRPMAVLVFAVVVVVANKQSAHLAGVLIVVCANSLWWSRLELSGLRSVRVRIMRHYALQSRCRESVALAIVSHISAGAAVGRRQIITVSSIHVCSSHVDPCRASEQLLSAVNSVVLAL